MLEGKIVRFSPDDAERVDNRFEQTTKVNFSELKKKQRDIVNEIKEIIYEKTYIEGMYDFIDIDNICEDKVYLSNSKFIESGILPNVFEQKGGCGYRHHCGNALHWRTWMAGLLLYTADHITPEYNVNTACLI
jgi:hypothetical protein